MNYDEALEISVNGQGTGKFRYTRTRDNHTIALGYCYSENHEHNTKQEAAACYRKFILDKYVIYNAGILSKTLIECDAKNCTEMTNQVCYIQGVMKQFTLCKDHQNRETLEDLLPSFEGKHIHS